MNKRRLAISVILVFSALIYSVYLFHDTLSPDEALYAWNALKLSENPGLIFSGYIWQDEPPFVYVCISILGIFLPNIAAARITIYLFALLGVQAAYLLGGELKDKRLGLLCALFLAVNPWYWLMSNRILLDVPAAALAALTVAFLLKYERTSRRRHLAPALVFLTACLLSKYTCAVFIPAAIIFLVAVSLRRKRKIRLLRHRSFLPLLWIFFAGGMRFLAGKRIEIRYLLPVLPAALPICLWKAPGLKRPAGFVLGAVFLALLAVGIKAGFIASYNKAGFKEAGEWLKHNVPPAEKTLITAGSLRQIRYYSGFEYEKYGGIIYSYGPEDNYGIASRNALREDYADYTVYLQIDFRDDYQAEWVFPPDKSRAEQIDKAGFKLVHAVYKDMPFYVMPPNEDRHAFLRYFGIKPYETVRKGSVVYVSGRHKYMWDFDDGAYIKERGFREARGMRDYMDFFFKRPVILRQPVVLIFKRQPL